MLYFLTIYLFVVLHSSNAFFPPSLLTDHEIQQDDVVGRYIELEKGSALELECTHPLNEGVQFGFPNLFENADHDPTDYVMRQSIVEVDGGTELIIKNVVESDTGTYSCHIIGDESIHESIYVFVKGPTVFIPFHAAGLAVLESEFVIPCKTSRHVLREDIQLEVNGKIWKTASKVYDPRFGFLMKNKNMEEKITSEQMFKCIYNGSPKDSAEFLITVKERTDTDSMVLEWNEPSPWPYLGGSYSLACVLRVKDGGRMQNRYEHYLNITCPRCDDKEAVHQSRLAAHHDQTVHVVNISSTTLEDSGKYVCNWYHETELLKSIAHTVNVSPKREQIKLLGTTPQKIMINELKTFRLSANLTGFPEDLPGFTAKWIRRFQRPSKTTNDTEIILTDGNHQLESDLPGNGLIRETLTVNNAHTNMSGIYVLTLTLMDTVKTVEFEVEVLSRQIMARIDIMTADSFVLFEQKYFKPGTMLRVLCLVTSLPHANVTIKQRRGRGGLAWIDVDPEQLTPINGTFDIGFQWDTTLEDDIDIRCSGETNNLSDMSVKRVRVSDTEPTVTTTWSSPFPSHPEDRKEIYEGDLVELLCMFPKDEEWKAKWVFKDSEMEDVEDLIPPSSHSRHLVAKIRNISSAMAGEYACVLSNNKNSLTLKQIINVKKTMKPYHTVSDPQQPLEIIYGSEVTLDCNMDGAPKPQYRWLKDGHFYEGGHFSEDNRTLTITRVVGEDRGEFVCEATNRAGTSHYKVVTKVEGAPKRMSGFFVLLLSILVLALIGCLLAFLVLYIKQRKRSTEQERALSVLYEQLMRAADGPPPVAEPKVPLDQRVYQLPYKRQFELARDNLEIGNRIGAGQFGQVWMGWLSKPRVSDQCVERARLPVAVKGPLSGRNAEHQKMLAEELKIMCAIGYHPNVLALIGAVTRNMKNGELFVVVEMCDNGNLKDYLLKNRSRFLNELKPVAQPSDGYLLPNSANRTQYAAEQNDEWSGEMETDRLLKESSALLATSDLISMSMQIANGMEYLASIPCIHRDLAARNILLTKNRFCRIADFGMARSENKNYYKVRKSKNIPVPYRWYSIEAIQTGLFTQESDVWSFGILLFEIFSLGGLPYPSISNEDLLDRLLSGHRNSRPEYCHEDIYALMQQCWETVPEHRPRFDRCLQTLKEHLKLASPQMLLRLETEIVQERERQAALSAWRIQEEDFQDQDVTGLAQGSQAPGSSKQEERIYIKEFDHPTT